MKRKIMFVYLKTGGGHYSPAKAISDFLITKFADDCETFLVDGLSGSNKFAKAILEDGYRFLQNHAVWVYEFIYLLHKIKLIASISNYLVRLNTIKYLSAQIDKQKPTTIVVIHFFLIKPVFEIIKKSNLEITPLILITDPYTAHPLWFVNKNAKFIVFSNELRTKCIDIGICKNNISVFQFVVNEKYEKPLNMTSVMELKNYYSLMNDKTVLIIGGADGIKNGKKIILEIIKKLPAVNIIIVCGRNKKLYEEISYLKLKNSLNNLIAIGFTENAYELINLADLVVTKCGASTIMQILLLKKIPLVNSYLWEQEKGNLEFIINNKIGFYIKKNSNVADKILNLLNNTNLIQDCRENINKQNLRNGLRETAQFICSS